MVYEQDSVILAGNSSFETVLDTACDRLREKQIQYSIRRIGELDDTLARLEKELDEFVGQSFRGPDRSHTD